MRKSKRDRVVGAIRQRGGALLSESWDNQFSDIRICCAAGHIFVSKPKYIVRGVWCSYCARDALKLDPQVLLDAAMEHGGICLNIDEYVDTKHELSFKCHLGHEWSTKPGQILGGCWCHECGGSKKLALEDCEAWAVSMGGKCLSVAYAGVKEKMIWECSKGHIWKSSFDAVKNGHTWCPHCSGVASKTEIDYHCLAEERGGRCLQVGKSTNDNSSKWQCSEGHLWNARYGSILFGSWCPACSNGKSQKILYGIIADIFPQNVVLYNYKGFAWLKTSKFGKQELDIYVPELKLAIEYDGEQHFKPMRYGGKVEMLEKIKKRDRVKNGRIKKHPEDVVYFVRIKYTEDLTKDLVVSKLKSVGVCL
jgi:hypothetical protein